MSRSIDVPAAEFAAVRATLKLSQAELAERLGISRRTVIRGERRGIELPSRWRGTDHRRREAWDAALAEAQAIAKGDTFRKILAQVSQRLESDRKARGFLSLSDVVVRPGSRLPHPPTEVPVAMDRAYAARRLALGRRPVTESRSTKSHPKSKPKKLARRKRR